MKRIILTVAIVCVLLAALLICGACDMLGKEGVGIAKIEKTATEGFVDTYTITLTNGDTADFTVTNGKDGIDGKDTANELDELDPNAPTPEEYFCFNLLEDGTYEVWMRYFDMPRKVVFPSEYQGKPVTKIYGRDKWKQSCNYSVEEIVLPRGIKVIGDDAFAWQAGLRSISIPSSVESMNSEVFKGCYSISSVYYSGTKAQWSELATEDYFSHSEQNYTVHCTDGDIVKE